MVKLKKQTNCDIGLKLGIFREGSVMKIAGQINSEVYPVRNKFAYGVNRIKKTELCVLECSAFLFLGTF